MRIKFVRFVVFAAVAVAAAGAISEAQFQSVTSAQIAGTHGPSPF